ncbi:MAG: DUF6599 family protein [Bacteroidales bacterium]
MRKNNMISKLLGIVFIITIIPVLSYSQDPSSMFPEVEGWEVNVGDQVYNPDNLWDLINGAADTYLSYNFQNLYTAEYSKTGDESVKAYIFKHGDNANAFGIYSQEKNRDYDFFDIGAQGFKSSGALYFIKGPYYVQLSTNDEGVYDELEPLAREIDKSLEADTKMPGEISFFPEEGKVENSERFIAEDFLGYNYMHSAFLADYKDNDDEFQMFILAPEDKNELKDMLDQFMDTHNYPEDKRDRKVNTVDAKYVGAILFYKSGDYVFGIQDADESTRDKYLKKLQNKH